jgi:hypothetical protein
MHSQKLASLLLAVVGSRFLPLRYEWLVLTEECVAGCGYPRFFRVGHTAHSPLHHIVGTYLFLIDCVEIPLEKSLATSC